ncbi:hypothetical protein I4U23_018829 [Adineta vaga]|nr:hypothetical protein I4U23_018829 [Adineta vaga]
MVAFTRARLLRQLQSSNKTTKSRSIRNKITKKKIRTVKQRTAPSSSTAITTDNSTTASVSVQAYNEVVGKSNITDALAYDCHWNPVGREYDLGRDGAFMGFSILIGQLYSDCQFNDVAMQKSIDELKMKGFQVKHVKSEDECIKELASNQYQVTWIVSSSYVKNRDIISSLKTFHSNGGGIFLFADNPPYTCHANEFLNKKFGITVDGCYYGTNTMTYAENCHEGKGHFGQHDIFTGIKNLYEGHTICHPEYSTEASRKVFVPIATASDGNTCIAVYDPSSSSTSNEGRICLDCGFTKLYIDWDSAGTARYIVNATTNEPITRVHQDTIDDYNRIVESSLKAYEMWKNIPAPKRGDIVRQIEDESRKNLLSLGKLISMEMGKILPEHVGPGHILMEQRNLLGILGVISTFNFQCAVLGWNQAFALACGNVTLRKGAPTTPLTSIATAKIIERVLTRNSLPGGLSSMICGIYDEVLSGLRRVYEQIESRIGEPFEESVLYRGSVYTERKGNYVQPRIVTDLKHDSSTVHQETFASILYVLKCKSFEEADQGLSSSIFTTNPEFLFKWIGPNGSDCTIVNVNIPTSGAEIGGAFGGEKHKGGGRESGSDSWKHTSNYSKKLPLAQAKFISKYSHFLITNSSSLSINKKSTTCEHLLKEFTQSIDVVNESRKERTFIGKYIKQISGGVAKVSSQTEQEVLFQGVKALEFYYERALWHADHALK